MNTTALEIVIIALLVALLTTCYMLYVSLIGKINKLAEENSSLKKELENFKTYSNTEFRCLYHNTNSLSETCETLYSKLNKSEEEDDYADDISVAYD